MRRSLTLAAMVAALVVSAGRATAQQEAPINPAMRPAVDRGVAFLKANVEGMDPGQAGIAALAFIKAGLPVDDPALVDCLRKIAPSFEGEGYRPLTNHAQGLYEASVVVLALANIAREQYRPQIAAAARYIIGKQLAAGGWDYPERTQGDESVSQYCLLALWEAELSGVAVPPRVWDRAARYYLSVQHGEGSWTYHRDSPNQGETLAMTTAGLGSLMLCEQQLAPYRKGQDRVNPLMVPVVIDGRPAESIYKVETPESDIRRGIARGLAWLIANFQVNTKPIMGQSPYYALYGIERVAALGKADDPTGKKPSVFGPIEWYELGLDLVLKEQKPAGAWEAQHDRVPNTCWAILFSVRATEPDVKIHFLRRLGPGHLQPGRGLPSDLTTVELDSQGRLIPRPMEGAVEEMLAVLEDPRADNDDRALRGLIEKFEAGGPQVIRPLKDRLLKLLRGGDPEDRLIAAWFLARIGDLDVAPDLIKVLADDDEDLVDEARSGLMILSRKLDGYGPEYRAPLEKRLEAARQWRAWFESVKPPELDAPVDVVPAK